MDENSTDAGPVQLRRRQLSLGMVGMGAALLGAPSAARPAPPAAPPAAPLSLALIELLPWASNTPAGARDGILVDVAGILATLSGVRLELQLLPFARAAMMLERGQIDCMVALQASTLDQVATRLAPLSDEDIVIVGRPGTFLRSLADLKGKIVGRLRHGEYDPQFAADDSIIKYDTSSYRQSLEMLRVGRLDAVIFIRSALEFTLKSMGLTAAAVGAPLYLGSCPLTLYAHRASVATASAQSLRAACKVVYKVQSVKALADMRMG